MIAPSCIDLSQQCLSAKLLKFWLNFTTDIFHERLSIALIQLSLECLDWGCAQIIDACVKLHVFFLREHKLFSP